MFAGRPEPDQDGSLSENEADSNNNSIDDNDMSGVEDISDDELNAEENDQENLDNFICDSILRLVEIKGEAGFSQKNFGRFT